MSAQTWAISGNDIVVARNGKVVATIPPKGEYARLIAAAPEGRWLVMRALTILECSAGSESLKKWTKAEQQRSWEHWKSEAAAYFARMEGTP